MFSHNVRNDFKECMHSCVAGDPMNRKSSKTWTTASIASLFDNTQCIAVLKSSKSLHDIEQPMGKPCHNKIAYLPSFPITHNHRDEQVRNAFSISVFAIKDPTPILRMYLIASSMLWY